PGSASPTQPPSDTPSSPTLLSHPAPAIPPPPAGPMSLEGLLNDLRQGQLVSAARLIEIARNYAGRPWSARDLGRELMTRDRLTPFQVNQLLQGHGRDLVRGPYVLLERIGQGGMGQVFKARHRKMNRL